MKALHVVEILVTCVGENPSTPPRCLSIADLNVGQEHDLEPQIGVIYTLTHDFNLTKSTKLVVVEGLLKEIAYTQVIRKLIKSPMIALHRLVNERFPLLNDCPWRLLRWPAVAAKELLERLEKFVRGHVVNWPKK
jgi:hypothetical protein